MLYCFSHSNGRFFSVEGLDICIKYFLRRKHIVKAFVPQYRYKTGQSSNPQLLKKLYEKGHVVFTPSREVNGRRITSYDDRYLYTFFLYVGIGLESGGLKKIFV